jgi:hypothetical protein
MSLPRYRIVQRPRLLDPSQPKYEVEKRLLFWWEPRGTFFDLEGARERVNHLKTLDQTGPVPEKVIQTYD